MRIASEPARRWAFRNIANAAGAWIGGLVIAAGYGYTAPAAAGSLLAVGGIIVLTASLLVQRRTSR